MGTKEIVDKQFELEGIDYDFERMKSSGLVQNKKGKNEWWYNIHQFPSEDRYLEWKNWALERIGSDIFRDIDLKFGMKYKYK